MHDDFIVISAHQFTIYKHLHPKLNLMIRHCLFVNRKSKGIVDCNHFIGCNFRKNDGILGDSDKLILHNQHRRNACYGRIKEVIKRKRQRDRLARIDSMVIVSRSVVDSIALVSEAAQWNGFDSGQSIHAPVAIDVALARLNRDSR